MSQVITHILNVTETPNTKYMGKFSTPLSLGQFDVLKLPCMLLFASLDSLIVALHISSCESW